MNALNYYGSKVRLSKYYPEPRHEYIIEPFAGGAGYSLRYPDRQVMLFDLDPRVIAAWNYLIHATSDDILGLPDLAPDQTIHDLDVPEGARWLVSLWTQQGAAFTLRLGAWARSLDLSRDARYWGPARRRKLAELAPKIRHWYVAVASYANLPNGEATWFVDPPYDNRAGRAYTHGADGIDYADLGAWCREREGQVIVCENEGADWLPFEPFREMNGIARNAAGAVVKSTEVVWTHEGGGE